MQEENDHLVKSCTRQVMVNGQQVSKFDNVLYTRKLILAATVVPDFSESDLCQSCLLDTSVGMPLIRGENGAVLPMGTGATAYQFVGVSGCEIKGTAGYMAQNVGMYYPDEPVSVFQRGCINVKCQKGQPVIDGPVYVRVIQSGSYAVGGFEADVYKRQG